MVTVFILINVILLACLIVSKIQSDNGLLNIYFTNLLIFTSGTMGFVGMIIGYKIFGNWLSATTVFISFITILICKTNNWIVSLHNINRSF